MKECLAGILWKARHDASADRTHLAMESAHEQGEIQLRPVIELTEPKALLEIVMAVGAAYHGDDMLALQSLGLIHHVGAAEQALGLLILRQMIEEGRQMLVEMVEYRVLDALDVGAILAGDITEAQASLQIYRTELNGGGLGLETSLPH